MKIIKIEGHKITLPQHTDIENSYDLEQTWKTAAELQGEEAANAFFRDIIAGIEDGRIAEDEIGFFEDMNRFDVAESLGDNYD